MLKFGMRTILHISTNQQDWEGLPLKFTTMKTNNLYYERHRVQCLIEKETAIGSLLVFKMADPSALWDVLCQATTVNTDFDALFGEDRAIKYSESYYSSSLCSKYLMNI